MTHALPIVPLAADNELLGSWLERTAAVYDLSAHQLLDRWQVAPRSKAGTMPSVEMRVVAANAMPLVADRTRTSPQVLRRMIPTIPEWLVASDADVAVCMRCLADDDAAGRPRFRRGGWGICCQVHCSQHRVPLVDMRGWRTGRLVDHGCVDQPLLRNANGSIVALGRRGDRGLSARVARRAICQLEVAMRGALAGRRPHAASWGEVDPEGFLRVVRDVATFVLNRFKPDDPRALLCARGSHRGKVPDSVHSFDQLRHRKTKARKGDLADFGSLAQVGKVGWRRSALYWTRELMHARTERSGLPLPLRRNRHERQCALLAGQSKAGIEWLSARARQWPERYRSQRWQALEAALAG